MYFEEYHGFKPGLWLHHPQLDSFLATNIVEPQAWETQLAQSLGMRLSMVRLMLATFMSVLVGLGLRFVPTYRGRLLYSAGSGAALLYYPFGNQIVLCFVPALLHYIIMWVHPRRAGRISWWLSFAWLLACMERTGDLWDSGEVDITGTLMVLTLKQVAICHNLSDGHSKRSAAFSAERRQLLIPCPPDPLLYTAYIFASGNLLAGPFFEFTEFRDFCLRQGPWAGAFIPGMWKHAVLASLESTAYALVSLAVYEVVGSYVDAFLLTEPSVWRLSLLQRYALAFVLAIVKRCSYYFIWYTSEAGIRASGFGFNGFKDEEKNKPLHNRYDNSDAIKVELCDSMAAIPRYWNINTGRFLRRYVYERVGGGVTGLALSQGVSGLWHGLREGNMAYFLMSIPMFQGSKVLYKQEKRLPKAIYTSKAWSVFKWAVGHAQNNVLCQPFLTMRWSRFWSTWQAFYFVPHLSVFALCVLGALVPPPRKHSPTMPEKVVDASPAVDKAKHA